MEDYEEVCNIGLGLSIGVNDQYVDHQKNKNSVACLDLSFPLYPKEEEAMDSEYKKKYSNDDIKNKNCNGKKQRLTREQTSMLEDSFKLRSTLNTVQKQELAERLNLRPRQVEVWFQNRRSRTKLKQTEVECGFL